MAYDFQIKAEPEHIRLQAPGIRVPGNQVKDILPVWAEAARACK